MLLQNGQFGLADLMYSFVTESWLFSSSVDIGVGKTRQRTVDELSVLPYAGHIIVAKQDVIATVHGSFLCASLEIGMLRRALMYLCELRQAKPRAMASHHAARADPSLPLQHRPHPHPADSTTDATGVDLSQTAAGRVFGATTASPWSGRTSGDKAAMTKAVHTTAGKPKRNLTMQVFLHCARIDVSMHC